MDNIFIAVVSYGTTSSIILQQRAFLVENVAACLVFASKAPGSRHKDETEEINGPPAVNVIRYYM